MRIGIFGGTFNPPHMGHLIVAERIREELKLDKVWFVPCAVPPHKTMNDIEEAESRLEMVKLAIEGNPNFDVLDYEVKRGGKSYTVETVEYLRRKYPNYTFFLLIGADQLVEFHTWHKPEKILELVNVVAFTRPGVDVSKAKKEYLSRVRLVTVPQIEISATEIRERVRKGLSIKYLVPDSVERYILSHKLYR